MKKLIEYGIIDKEYVDELENLRIERNWTDRYIGVLIKSHLKEQSISQEHLNWMVDQLSDKYKEYIDVKRLKRGMKIAWIVKLIFEKQRIKKWKAIRQGIKDGKNMH